VAASVAASAAAATLPHLGSKPRMPTVYRRSDDQRIGDYG
jgi:hypothetical protein